MILSAEDKLSLAKFLEGSTVSLGMLNTVLPVVKDDGLKKLVEGAIATTEAQVKSVQEFCGSHGINPQQD